MNSRLSYMARTKDKVVFDIIGCEKKFVFLQESSDKNDILIATKNSFYRSYYSNVEKIFEKDTKKSRRKDYDTVASKFKNHGETHINYGPLNGFSFWIPHCCPKVVYENIPKGATINCCELNNYSLEEAKFFNIVQDRVYELLIDGNILTFNHSLLVPNGEYTQDELEFQVSNIIFKNCNFSAGGEANDDYFNGAFETPGGKEFAVQNSLRLLYQDNQNPLSERMDAFILAGWIGSFDKSIDDLEEDSIWAVMFIYRCLEKYGISNTMDSTDILNYSEALDSCKFIVGKFADNQY